jgi:hypothetical protein
MKVRIDSALILRQPWARIVCEGVLPVLVRGQPTRKTGYVGVVSSGQLDQSTVVTDPPEDLPLHSLVGVVHLGGCVRVNKSPLAVLRRLYGKTMYSFYPKHFLPSHPPYYFWVVKKAGLLSRSIYMRRWLGISWTRLRPTTLELPVFTLTGKGTQKITK